MRVQWLIASLCKIRWSWSNTEHQMLFQFVAVEPAETRNRLQRDNSLCHSFSPVSIQVQTVTVCKDSELRWENSQQITTQRINTLALVHKRSTQPNDAFRVICQTEMRRESWCFCALSCWSVHCSSFIQLTANEGRGGGAAKSPLSSRLLFKWRRTVFSQCVLCVVLFLFLVHVDTLDLTSNSHVFFNYIWY